MLRRTLAMAWFRRNRYLLAVVAIGLSVAFIVSTLLLTTSIADVGEPLDEAYADVDAVVTGALIAESDGPAAGARSLIDPDALDAVRTEGFEAVGLTDPYAQIIDSAGDPARQAQSDANIAEPWLGDSPLNGFVIVDGAASDAPGTVAVDRRTADAAGLSVGDPIEFVTDDGLRSAELVGIATFGGADNDPYTSTVLLEPDDPVFAAPAGFDRILVAGNGTPVEVTATVTALPILAVTEDSSATDASSAAGEGPTGATVLSGPDWIAGEVEELNSFLGFFETFLTVFAVVAVVVGVIIVTNTFTVSLAQRTQELALLRLVGTSCRQLMFQVVIEAILLGIAGTVVGVARPAVSRSSAPTRSPSRRS